MGSEIRKWADPAMFAAEAMPVAPGDGWGTQPQVFLLDPPTDPLGHIAAACMMYEGKVIKTTRDVTDEQRRYYLEQVKRTKLQAPFEFVDFHFMLEGLPRDITHQIVRQRTAVYAQESMRFAVKGNMAIEAAVPPSLQGVTLPEHEHWRDLLEMALSPEQQMLVIWRDAMMNAQSAYDHLVKAGMPAEDARGVAPHDVTTRMHYKSNLRSLIEHAGNRLCTQAQFEWRVIWSLITEAIASAGRPAWMKYQVGELGEENSSEWQYRLLTKELFRPACFLAGHCPFEAQFDRHCSIRGRVREFAAHGVEPQRWEHGARVDRGDTFITLEPIRPEEWLMDPKAARA